MPYNGDLGLQHEISCYKTRSRVEIEISPPFEIRIVTVFFHTEEGLYILNVCVLF